MFLSSRNPWLRDVIKSCLQRDPKKRPEIGGSAGLLEHPFLKPQGMRAMQLYKELAMNSSIMHDLLQQIHENAGNEILGQELSLRLRVVVTQPEVIDRGEIET